jgi:hypothetical protein
MNYLAEDALGDEPTFPEEQGHPARQLDFYGRPMPPINRELRRLLYAHYRRHCPDAAWFVPMPLHSKPYYYFSRIDSAEQIPLLIAEFGLLGASHLALESAWRDVFMANQQNDLRQEFVQAGLQDPLGILQIYGTSCWVLLVDWERLGDREPPRGWEDLFDPRFHGEIVINGDDTVPAALLLTHLALDYGIDAMETLGRATRNLAKGSEMARAAGSQRRERGTIYVLPWFWANNNIHRSRTAIVWPQEGAYCSPFYWYAQAQHTPASQCALEFLQGPIWGKRVESIHCIVAQSTHACREIPGRLRWMGWDQARDDCRPSLHKAALTAFQNGLDR